MTTACILAKPIDILQYIEKLAALSLMHTARYWILKKGHWLLSNPDPHQNLRDSDVTRCGSALTLVLTID
jgi:hypothetical protein